MNEEQLRQSNRDFFKDAFGYSDKKESAVVIEDLDDDPRSLLRRNKKNKKPVNIEIDREADILKLLEDFAPLAAR